VEEVDFADGVVVVFEVGGVAGEVLGGDVSGTDGLWRMEGNTSSFRLSSFSCWKLLIFAARLASALVVEIVEKVVGFSVYCAYSFFSDGDMIS
jgi:hypothetical protein